jgi:drug/metabolite transporter (DMT)-like permease
VVAPRVPLAARPEQFTMSASWDWTERRQDRARRQPSSAQTQGIEARRGSISLPPPVGAQDPGVPVLTTASSAGPIGFTVAVAVLVAAALHAVWNALAHVITDALVGFALIGTAVTICAAGIVMVSSVPSQASWPFLAASAVLHVLYNLLLMRCYRLGEFGQVYPVARGTSVWLVAIGAAAFAGEQLPAIRLAGVLVVSAGLATLVFAGGIPTRAAWPAIAAAVLTGVAIAAYTTLDGLGVRHAGTAAGYAGWLFLLQSPVLPLAAVATRRGQLWRQARPHLLAGLAGGVLSLVAYGLVLWAQTRGALAPIAALRETSVIIGAAIGNVVFHERVGSWRIAATILVVFGVILINL